MIMIWNRQEIFSGFSLDIFCTIRDMLSSNNIKYESKVVSRNGSTLVSSDRSNSNNFNHDFKLSYEYYIYVHKNDYKAALSAINKEKI